MFRMRVLIVLMSMLMLSSGVGLVQAASTVGTAGGISDWAAKPSAKPRKTALPAASPVDPAVYPVRAVSQGELTLWLPEKVEQGGVMLVRAAWKGLAIKAETLEFRHNGKALRAELRGLSDAEGAQQYESVALLPVPPDAPAGCPWSG